MQDGLDFEQKFLNECSHFLNAESGVCGQDVEAAMILRSENKYDLLRLLHLRRVQLVGDVQEGDTAEDLEFQTV